MNTETLDALEWHIMPQDAGQMVEHAYAADGEAEKLFRRTRDRSDGTVSFASTNWGNGDFAPWNGELPSHGEWIDMR